MKKQRRMSLRTKYSLVFAGIILLLVCGIAIANQILLGRVYYSRKTREITQAYETISAVFEEDNIDSIELEKIYSTRNIIVYVEDENGKEIFSSWRFLEDEKREEENERPPHEAFREPMRREPARRSVGGRAEHNLEQGTYEIRNISDNRLGAKFIQLNARLNNGYLLCMSAPLTGIEDAAKTANGLLICIGLIAAVLGLAGTMAAVSVTTKPIYELTDIARDMSELKFVRKYTGKHKNEIGELGESINVLSDKLEKAISELKRSNEQLEKDIEFKNSVDKMRKEFIAGASHELKTPLALILGYAEGLKNNIAASPEDRAFYSEVIIDEAARMDALIKQFLTVTELEETALPEMQKLDLSETVREAVQSCSILAEQKGVSLDSHVDENITVFGDESVLWQAVTNYITNAIHYVDDKKIIKIALNKVGDKVRFSVYNSGENIPDDAGERIWESFYKRDKARTRTYGGSGLGLSIVKRAVELHGGVYGFDNYPDGIEFYFEI